MVGDPRLVTNDQREFEQRFPGIKVNVTANFRNILAPQIDEQMRQGKLAVDLTIFQTLQDYERWKKAGVLLPFKPEGFDRIHPTFKDADGAYIAVTIGALAYAYNRDKVPATVIPKSALDFLKPSFSGKLITAYPQDDDITLYVFSIIVRKYGWGFMDKYGGHLDGGRRLALGWHQGIIADCPL